MKKLYCTNIFLVLFFVLIYSEAIAVTKVAFVEMDNLIGNSKIGKSLIKQLVKIDSSNKNFFKDNKNKLESKKKKIEAQKNILSKDEYNKKVIALNVEFELYQKDIESKIQLLKKKRDNGMNKILNELNLILSEYSKQNELTFIIDQKNIIIGKSDLNITNEIMKKLDSKITKIKID
jgi:outer membrane protein